MSYDLTINGQTRTVDADGDIPLLWVLRDVLDLTGTKFGCGAGLCGCCTVHIDGIATRACLTMIDSVGSAEVATVEAIGDTPIGKRVQQAWLDLEVVQCGYCQSGQIMSAVALLSHTADPSDAVINEAMAGNLCRCGTYGRIREAIKLAARSQASESEVAQ